MNLTDTTLLITFSPLNHLLLAEKQCKLILKTLNLSFKLKC